MLFVGSLSLWRPSSMPSRLPESSEIRAEAMLLITMIQEYEAGRLPDHLGPREIRDSGPELKH